MKTLMYLSWHYSVSCTRKQHGAAACAAACIKYTCTLHVVATQPAMVLLAHNSLCNTHISTPLDTRCRCTHWRLVDLHILDERTGQAAAPCTAAVGPLA